MNAKGTLGNPCILGNLWLDVQRFLLKEKLAPDLGMTCAFQIFAGGLNF